MGRHCGGWASKAATVLNLRRESWTLPPLEHLAPGSAPKGRDACENSVPLWVIGGASEGLLPVADRLLVVAQRLRRDPHLHIHVRHRELAVRKDRKLALGDPLEELHCLRGTSPPRQGSPEEEGHLRLVG